LSAARRAITLPPALLLESRFPALEVATVAAGSAESARAFAALRALDAGRCVGCIGLPSFFCCTVAEDADLQRAGVLAAVFVSSDVRRAVVLAEVRFSLPRGVDDPEVIDIILLRLTPHARPTFCGCRSNCD